MRSPNINDFDAIAKAYLNIYNEQVNDDEGEETEAAIEIKTSTAEQKKRGKKLTPELQRLSNAADVKLKKIENKLKND